MLDAFLFGFPLCSRCQQVFFCFGHFLIKVLETHRFTANLGVFHDIAGYLKYFLQYGLFRYGQAECFFDSQNKIGRELCQNRPTGRRLNIIQNLENITLS